MALADQAKGTPHGFANPAFYENAASFYDVLSVKTAVARRNFNDSVDATDGTVDRLRTLDDYSGSPTQYTSPGVGQRDRPRHAGRHLLALAAAAAAGVTGGAATAAPSSAR
jgi:hypothetical protein